jgi:hypothetical protein
MIAPPDYANMPEKRCLAACPSNVPCECRERARALRLRDGTFTTRDMFPDDQDGEDIANIVKKY